VIGDWLIGGPFTLEVTGGTATISANTIVTVNNSPPTVVASGGGTYEVGTNISLTGQVTDYDGDDLICEWKDYDSICNRFFIVVTRTYTDMAIQI